jgi:hypothetical protein
MTNVEKVMEMNKEGKPDWEVKRTLRREERELLVRRVSHSVDSTHQNYLYQHIHVRCHFGSRSRVKRREAPETGLVSKCVVGSLILQKVQYLFRYISREIFAALR